MIGQILLIIIDELFLPPRIIDSQNMSVISKSMIARENESGNTWNKSLGKQQILQFYFIIFYFLYI